MGRRPSAKWSSIRDLEERRRAQNRLAQQRKRQKKNLQASEAAAAATANETASQTASSECTMLDVSKTHEARSMAASASPYAFEPLPQDDLSALFPDHTQAHNGTIATPQSAVFNPAAQPMESLYPVNPEAWLSGNPYYQPTRLVPSSVTPLDRDMNPLPGLPVQKPSDSPQSNATDHDSSHFLYASRDQVQPDSYRFHDQSSHHHTAQPPQPSHMSLPQQLSQAAPPHQQQISMLQQPPTPSSTASQPVFATSGYYDQLASSGLPTSGLERCAHDILQTTRAAGFHSIEAFLLMYYTTSFPSSAAIGQLQRHSRRRDLGTLLSGLARHSTEWPARDAQGYREGITSAVEDVVRSEVWSALSPPQSSPTGLYGNDAGLSHEDLDVDQLHDELPHTWSILFEMARSVTDSDEAGVVFVRDTLQRLKVQARLARHAQAAAGTTNGTAVGSPVMGGGTMTPISLQPTHSAAGIAGAGPGGLAAPATSTVAVTPTQSTAGFVRSSSEYITMPTSRNMRMEHSPIE